MPRLLMIALLAATAGFLAWPAEAIHADGPDGARAGTALEALPPGEGEKSVILSARLLDAEGQPVAGQKLSFYVVTDVFGERLMKVGEPVTDLTGTAWVIHEPRGEGRGTAVVHFDGDDDLAPAQAALSFSARTAPHLHENARFGLEPVRAWLPVAVGIVILAVWGTLALVVVRTVIGIPAAAPAPRAYPIPSLPSLRPASLAPRLALATAVVALAVTGGWLLLQQRNQETASLIDGDLGGGGRPDGGHSISYPLVAAHTLATSDAPPQEAVYPGAAATAGELFVLTQGELYLVTGDAEADHVLLASAADSPWLPGTTAIAARDGLLYAANRLTGDISITDASGRLQRTIRPLLPPALKPLRPSGLAVTERGEIWLSDSENRRVFLLDVDGTMLRAIGDPWQAAGNYAFAAPAGLALDEAGNVYVVDRGEALIKKYSQYGIFLLAIGAAPGQESSVLHDPRELAVDSTGTLFVTDSGARGVQVFAAGGTYAGEISQARRNASAPQLGEAHALSAGGGRLYILDDSSRLLVLALDPAP